MELKLSDYNVIIDEIDDGDLLIYNSFTSALGVLEKKNKFIYDNVENLKSECLSKDELECVQAMKENGFLIDKNFNEYNAIKVKNHRNRYSKESLALTIAPTMACNLSCPYCYEKNVDKSRSMTKDVQKKLIEFIESKIKNLKLLTVAWYGGEPLLGLNVIKDLSKDIITLCEDNEVEYLADIVTNGTLLDKETAIVLKEQCKVDTAQVTIDGTEKIHNQRRGLRNNENSFKKIVENVNDCLDIMKMSVRINVDSSNMEETIKLIDYFEKEMKWTNKVRYYFSKVRNYVNKDDTLCLSKNETCLTSEEYFDFSIKLYKIMHERGYASYFEDCYPLAPDISCSAITENYYVIDPEGDIYTCWILIGNKDRKIGNVNNPEIILNNPEKILWLSTDIPRECDKCSLMPLCQGGCPIHYMNGQLECRHDLNSLKQYIKIFYEISAS